MRRPLIAANWKMNKTVSETGDFLRDLSGEIGSLLGVEVVIAPPAIALAEAARAMGGSNLVLAAQNMHWEREGAFTGETSASMLRDVGCRYVILGHSERRQLFGESDGEVGRKVHTALTEGIVPILCLGETLGEREYGKTFEVVERQLRGGLETAAVGRGDELVVAYEPVWAIGTGKTSSPEAAQEVHAYLRGLLINLLGKEVGEGVRILYGGSVKPDNVDALMSMPDIDGALVGGASLQMESFARIAKFSMS